MKLFHIVRVKSDGSKEFVDSVYAECQENVNLFEFSARAGGKLQVKEVVGSKA